MCKLGRHSNSMLTVVHWSSASGQLVVSGVKTVGVYTRVQPKLHVDGDTLREQCINYSVIQTPN